MKNENGRIKLNIQTYAQYEHSDFKESKRESDQRQEREE